MEKSKENLETIRKYAGDMEAEFIGENDSFDFKCQQCGRCCMNRTDIILNPFDIYNGAKYLGITPLEFLSKYTYPTSGSASKIPMVILDCDDRGYCPLLEFDVKGGGKFKCIINPAKPGVCSNHPLGIIREHDKNSGEHTYQFIKISQCGNSKGHNQMNVVKDWCKNYLDNLEETRMAQQLQLICENYFPSRLLDTIVQMVSPRNEEELKEMLDSDFYTTGLIAAYKGFQTKYIEVAYTKYDTTKPFMEQALANLVELVENLLNPVTKLLYLYIKEMDDESRKLVGEVLGFPSIIDDFLKKNKEMEEKHDG